MVSFRFRKTIRKIHLCLGLLTGTIVFLVALSGALYCFAPELELLTQPYRFTGDAGGAAGHAGGAAGDAVGQPLAPDRLLGIAATEVPGRQPGRIYYHGAGRSVEIVYYKDKKADKALFLHPRSGVLLQVKDLRTDPVQQLFYFLFTHAYAPSISAAKRRSAATIFPVTMLAAGKPSASPKATRTAGAV